MSTMRTNQEIDAEIAALKAIKPRVPAHSFFGDDNHAAIDAQLAVMTERMSQDDVYSRFGEDDNATSKWHSEHVLCTALDAFNWMACALADHDSPTESWKGIAK